MNMSSEGVAPCNVLVVDDDPDIRELLAEYLRDRGLSVATAHDGRAAVSALERSEGCFRLVLTDISMPGADGFTVLRAALDANDSAYVVMITGYASIDSAVQAVRLGAQDYLAKPFTLGQIEVIVQQARARFDLQDEHRALLLAQPAQALAAVEDRLAAIERTLDLILTCIGSHRPSH